MQHVHNALPTAEAIKALEEGRGITLICAECKEPFPWPNEEVKKINADPTTFTLFGGAVLKIHDWANAPSQGFYSAFIVTPDGHGVGDGARHDWTVFAYGRGDVLPGDPTRSATKAHTNVVRPGCVGLPKDWEMLIYKWRATLSLTLIEPVQEWAAETSVTFQYNGKIYGEAALIDLVLNPQPADFYKAIPVHMREHLHYCADVQSAEAPTRRLRDWLASSSTPRKCMTAWIHIEGPVKRSII
jgi:hypothetical protein